MRCTGVSIGILVIVACADALPVLTLTDHKDFRTRVTFWTWFEDYHTDAEPWELSGSGSAGDDNWADQRDYYDSGDKDAPATAWDVEIIWGPISDDLSRPPYNQV